MPVMPCRSRGRPGFKYGSSGKCYTYKENNTQSRVAARNRAEKQGRAIAISKAREAGHRIPKQ
jgi:hypothetical protein